MAGPALRPGRPRAGAAGGSLPLSLPVSRDQNHGPLSAVRTPVLVPAGKAEAEGMAAGGARGATFPCRLQPQAVLPDPEAWSCSPDHLPTWLGFGAQSVKGGQVRTAE